jgi:exopolysaccharide production protein ExoZ
MLYSVQVLRGIAAVLVVIIHSEDMMYRYYKLQQTQIFDDARSGVDLFFVISGFIMTYTISNKNVGWSDFIANRIIRVVPLYWFFTLLLAVLIIFVPNLFSNLSFDLYQFIYSLLFFPNAQPPIVGIGWTLNYEMFFYLIFSISLLLPKPQGFKYIWLILVLLVALGLLISTHSPVFSHITSPLLLEFLAGSIVARIWIVYSYRGPYAYIAMALGFLLIVLPMGEQRVIDWGIGAVILFIGMLTLPRQSFWASNNVLIKIGEYSYSLYLSHDFVLPALGKLWFLLHLDTIFPKWVLPITTTIMSIIISAIVFYIVEKPLTQFFSKAWKKHKQIGNVAISK